jgi:CDP-diacylglycerol--glycerol-3-phosphate 3-phosphatidyltransferase
MVTDWVRRWSGSFLIPIARFVSWTGVSPNGITIIGFALTVVVAFLLAMGYFPLGGALLIVAAFFDGIDGALARLLNRVTRFGAFLDSTTDRFSEAALFLGLLIYYHGRGAGVEVILCYMTIIGSLMVSYTRARAEGLGIPLREGLFTRLERMVALIAGLLLSPWVPLWFVLGLLAVLSNFTALQRIWLVWWATRESK